MMIPGMVELIPGDAITKFHRVTAAINIKYNSPAFPCYTLTFQYLLPVAFFILDPFIVSAFLLIWLF